jgi:aryl-alcohol dehydrogenase-like predicted oxidoreductase
MQYRRLGRSGLHISSLALGSMNFGNSTTAGEAAQIIDAALDAGINLIDCADVYAGGASERIVGEVLKKNRKRHDVFITSKVYWRTGDRPNDAGNSRQHIFAACESSLKRLQTDYIDIYFLHRTDFNLPQEESLAALDLLVHQGKIRYIGCSTHPAWRVVEALWLADKYRYPKFVTEQPPYNLLDRRAENEIIPMCRAYDLGLITWSPLAQGVLAGRYRDAAEIPAGSRGAQKQIYAERISAEGIEAAGKLSLRAQAKGCSLAQMALAWILHQAAVTATIVGPRTRNHLDDLLPAVHLDLDDTDLEFCDRLIPPGTYVSDHFNTAGWQNRAER